jgi:hypothetical protein
VTQALHVALQRSAAYEQMPQVRALLQHGGALAEELNACADPTAVAASATDAERHSAWAVQSEVEQKMRQLEALREPEVVQKQLKLAQGCTLHAELAQCSCNIKADENGKYRERHQQAV